MGEGGRGEAFVSIAFFSHRGKESKFGKGRKARPGFLSGCVGICRR